MSDEPEVVLSRIVHDLKPEIDQMVAELGRDQVIRNALSGLAKLEERRRAREAANLKREQRDAS